MTEELKEETTHTQETPAPVGPFNPLDLTGLVGLARKLGIKVLQVGRGGPEAGFAIELFPEAPAAKPAKKVQAAKAPKAAAAPKAAKPVAKKLVPKKKK